jgi:hypothetical protein
MLNPSDVTERWLHIISMVDEKCLEEAQSNHNLYEKLFVRTERFMIKRLKEKIYHSRYHNHTSTMHQREEFFVLLHGLSLKIM